MLRTNECCGFEKGKGKHDSQEDKINQLTYSQDIITLLLSCVHKLVPRREVKAVVEMNPKTNVTLKTAASCPSGGIYSVRLAPLCLIYIIFCSDK